MYFFGYQVDVHVFKTLSISPSCQLSQRPNNYSIHIRTAFPDDLTGKIRKFFSQVPTLFISLTKNERNSQSYVCQAAIV